ncbi:uncharacterized protein K489DRAFT_217703 [Dissoconium aciculare CBS 342.82]|uniref:Uncharacterized protein n=1 Tax=Dissoconium aciculare CBS 342.82 TaxID=1314786 RepID=A0A6J3M7J9_9PEZI|nr:uncharacterized protein K489DRAFT_217703 [Dissoconium aciculare CBS 342.82]KAF1822827.1 hypothetical protein K489DRAFT_217703 [Dissoconium aciculare CBS 342.82]
MPPPFRVESHHACVRRLTPRRPFQPHRRSFGALLGNATQCQALSRAFPKLESDLLSPVSATPADQSPPRPITCEWSSMALGAVVASGVKNAWL